jgi:hypothetical protein
MYILIINSIFSLSKISLLSYNESCTFFLYHIFFLGRSANWTVLITIYITKLPSSAWSIHQYSFYGRCESNKEVCFHLHHLSYLSIWSILSLVVIHDFSQGKIWYVKIRKANKICLRFPLHFCFWVWMWMGELACMALFLKSNLINLDKMVIVFLHNL